MQTRPHHNQPPSTHAATAIRTHAPINARTLIPLPRLCALISLFLLSTTLQLNAATFSNTSNISNTSTGSPAACAEVKGTPGCAGAGDPINVMTGNQYQAETDLPALPGLMGIEIVRHYNSLHMGLGSLGYGWRLGYEIDLSVHQHSLHITHADGSHTIFNRSIFNPSDCACQDPAQGHVMIYHTAQGDEYTWYTTDGKQLHFNASGKLERITAPTGESTHLTRGPKGELLTVTDPQGRSLIMHYAEATHHGKRHTGFKGIIAIDSPLGQFSYQHNNDRKSPGISNLIQVGYPQLGAGDQGIGARDQGLGNEESQTHNHTPSSESSRLISKTYHYGEPAYVDAHMAPSQNTRPLIPQAAHLLTSTSLTWRDNTRQTKTGQTTTQTQTNQTQTGQTTTTRHRTWMYDALGRGILSVHGTPNSADASQQVKLSYRVVPPKSELNPNNNQPNNNQPSNNQPSNNQPSNNPPTNHQQVSVNQASVNQTPATQTYPRITHNGQIGQTILTNSLGQTTSYYYTLIAGEYRLLQILGAGCSECAEPNIVYGYDTLGRQTDVTKVALNQNQHNQSQHNQSQLNQTKLNQSRPNTHKHTPDKTKHTPSYTALSTRHTDYDNSGRILNISHIPYRNGKPQTAQQQIRYAYPNTPRFPQLKQAKRAVQEPIQVFNQPSLIAKPSVVAGKEHQWHLRYNQFGQATQITETGYAPALPSNTASTASTTISSTISTAISSTVSTTNPDKHRITPISRTTTYSYRRINGRSLLSQIDAPLPNGNTNSPLDSDVTQYQYDKHGYLTAVVQPLGLTATFNYDAATGRAIRYQDTDGISTFAYNTKGQLTQMQRGYRQLQISYDAQNRAIAWHSHDGKTITAHFDEQTHQVRYTMPDGQSLLTSLSSELQVTDIGWQNAQQQAITTPKHTDYDPYSGLPTAITAPTGLKTLFTYDENQQLTQVQRGRQISSTQFDPINHLITSNLSGAQYTTSKQADTQSLTLPTEAQYTRTVDDFGRIIAMQSPDTGISLAQYDAANHLIQLSDHLRTSIARYDALGRLTQRQHRLNSPTGNNSNNDVDNNSQTETFTYQYTGTKLTSIIGATQRTDYQYTPEGQLAQEVTSTNSQTFTTTYQYDHLGRLTTTHLPEGTTLTQHYNTISNLTRIDYQAPIANGWRGWWTTLARLINTDYGTQALIANIQTDSAHGLLGYSHANGQTAQAQFDQAGRLTRWHDGQLNTQLNFNHLDELASLTQQKQASTTEPQAKLQTKQQTLQYNVFGQLTAVKSSVDANAKRNESYAYDLNGNRLQSTFESAQAPEKTADLKQTAVLATGTKAANAETFTLSYKPASDQLQNIQTGLSNTSYRYNSQGEPVEISTTHHDTNQNNTATPNGKHNSQTRTFTYGTRGELLTISDNGKLTASYQYNYALQRISKTVAGKAENNSQSTQYHWHGGLLDAESQLDSQGNPQITKRYFYLNLRPVAVIEYAGSTNQQRQDASPSTQLYAIHSDHLGTPQVLSNAQQQVVWQAEYASFGQATVTAMQLKQGAESSRIESNSASNAYGLISTAQANTQQPSVPPKHFEFNLRFAGQYADTESGYHYNWHRYYDPATGRYLTPDPIGLQGGLNAYGYVGQNPLQGVDPAGLRCATTGSNVNCITTFGDGSRINITFPKPADFIVPVYVPFSSTLSFIWPDVIDDNDEDKATEQYHTYTKNTVSLGTCKSKDFMPYIIAKPTPGLDANAATAAGAQNYATPPAIELTGLLYLKDPAKGLYVTTHLNPIKSYLINDNDTGRQYVVNVTQPGHSLFPGYVARFVEDTPTGAILHNLGEGNSYLQSPHTPAALHNLINNVWFGMSEEVIDKAGAGKK